MPVSTEAAISVTGLSKRYSLYARPRDRLRDLLSLTTSRGEERWALRDVSFCVPRGATWGIVGRNGAGKSTLLKIVSGKLKPSSGEVLVRGHVSSILELGTGFQEHLTGRQNAKINALFSGHDPWQIDGHLDEILEFAGLGPYADQPLYTYSSGMKARLAFAVMTSMRPEVLVLDEALATGDAGFAEKCRRFLRRLCASGCTALLTGHDTQFLIESCDRLLWLDEGRLRAEGEPTKVAETYLASVGHEQVTLDRPKNLLFRLKEEGEGAGEPIEYPFHCLEWVGAGGEVLASRFLGEELVFQELARLATHLGLTPAAARAGWGQGQEHPVNQSTFRVMRPRLGPGGACYLAVPVPALPQPRPVAVRVAGKNDQPRPLVLSALVDGAWQELGQFGATGVRDGSPWYRTELPLPYSALPPVAGGA